MALDQNKLQAAIEAAFKKAKETPPPSDPNDTQTVQAQVIATLALDLATALKKFVMGGDITGVQVSVVDEGDTVIGSGAQTNTVHLK